MTDDTQDDEYVEAGVATSWSNHFTPLGKRLWVCTVYGERLVVHRRAGRGLIARYVGRERGLDDSLPLPLNLSKAVLFAVAIAQNVSNRKEQPS